VVADVAVRRGRPSNADLTARVERQASILASLRLELRVLRDEGRAHAQAVRAHGRRVQMLAQAIGSPATFHEGMALEALADRHERRMGGAA
jgi:hypothetical protein